MEVVPISCWTGSGPNPTPGRLTCRRARVRCFWRETATYLGQLFVTPRRCGAAVGWGTTSGVRVASANLLSAYVMLVEDLTGVEQA